MTSDRSSAEIRGVARLGEGFGLLMEAVRLLRSHRSLWPLASVPVFFAFAFVSLALVIFWNGFEWVYATWTAVLPVIEAGSWWTWIWVGPAKALLWIAGWLGVLMAFATTLLASLLLANLASAPFLDLLSQRVEAIVQGRVDPGATGFAGIAADIGRSFWAELSRLGFLGGLWLGLTLVGFIVPGAHLLTAPLLVGLTILFLPLDYAGYALDRRRVKFRERRLWLRENLSTMVGFGAIGFGGCLVPGLNLLLMPALVTAGTLLVLRREPTTSVSEWDSAASA